LWVPPEDGCVLTAHSHKRNGVPDLFSSPVRFSVPIHSSYPSKSGAEYTKPRPMPIGSLRLQMKKKKRQSGKKKKEVFFNIFLSLPSYILPNSQSKAHRLIQNNLLREFHSVTLLSTPVSIQSLVWIWLDLPLSFSS